MKKFIICLLVFVTIIFVAKRINAQKTVECWWGVCYPQLSFVVFEDEDEDDSKISSIDPEYFYIKENDIKIKFWLISFLKEKFK